MCYIRGYFTLLCDNAAAATNELRVAARGIYLNILYKSERAPNGASASGVA